MAGWQSAHEWSESHTQAMDKELAIPNKVKSKELIVERNKEINHRSHLDTGMMDNLNFCKKKMVKFCIKHLDQKFKIAEAIGDLPEIKQGHYKKKYEMAKTELLEKGYDLIKTGKAWYTCSRW